MQPGRVGVLEVGDRPRTSPIDTPVPVEQRQRLASFASNDAAIDSIG
jgi:hypothetical protein